MADEPKPTRLRTGPAALSSDTPGVVLPGNNSAPRPAAAEAPEETPADRVGRAIAGKPKKSFVEVRAADLDALAKPIPADRHTETTAALYAGAQNALGTATGPRAAELTVYVVAGHAAELLEAARGEPVQPGA